MQDLAKYQDCHRELVEMIGDLQSFLTPEMLSFPPNMRLARQLLCDLLEKVEQHLVDEDCGLYPALFVHRDPKIKGIAWAFMSSERPLRSDFGKYRRKWLRNCRFQLTEAFLRETSELFQMLSERIAREEQILFPKLVALGFFYEQRCA